MSVKSKVYVFTIIRFDIMFGYPLMGFAVDVIINCVFLTKGFQSSYKRNSVKFSIEFPMLEYFWFHMLLNRSLGARFSNEFDINMPCDFGSRHDNFIGIRAVNF